MRNRCLYFLCLCFLSGSPGHAEPFFTDQWAGRPVLTAEHADGMVKHRLSNAPRPGEKAPDTVFIDEKSGRGVLLSELYRDRPAVLFFGSYSCLPVRDSVNEMKELEDRFGDDFQFLFVQIREAHADGGLPPPVPRGREFVTKPPHGLEQRIALARKLREECGMPFRFLIDPMEDTNAVRWAAWPVRLFVVDREGIVRFAGRQGPWFFQPMRGTRITMTGVPVAFGEVPGYSRESLEEFLETFLEQPVKEKAGTIRE